MLRIEAGVVPNGLAFFAAFFTDFLAVVFATFFAAFLPWVCAGSISSRAAQRRFPSLEFHAEYVTINGQAVPLYSVGALDRVRNEIEAILENQGKGMLAVFGSVAGDRGRQSNYLYGATKSALETFLAGLRHRFASMPEIRIILLKPGMTDTPMTANMEKGPQFSPASRVGADAWNAIRKGKPVAYLPSCWRGVMFVIRLLPDFVLHRTKL